MSNFGNDENVEEDNDLHVAVRLGDLDAVRTALKNGCHPDTIGLFQWSALHEASSNGDIDILKLLLNHHGSPNNPDKLNSNTALHYACTEDHSECLHVLLSKGGDPKIENDKGESCVDLATSRECKNVLKENGCEAAAIKEKALVSILKANKSKAINNRKDAIKIKHKPVILTQPIIRNQKNTMSETHNTSFDSDSIISTPTSVDSGTCSPDIKIFKSSKEAWDSMIDKSLQVPSSPTRSQGSSYGSMMSLNSSGCSTADDCAGQFILSFQYNCKKQEFKVRVWEISLNTLVAPNKMPKDTSMHLYVKSTILPDDEFKPNPTLRRKSEVFRLQPGEHTVPKSESHSAMEMTWLEKSARMEFKSALSLEYTNVTKDMTLSSAIQISLCIKPKRSIITNKSKPHAPDPLLASFEIRMNEAVRRIMKQSYDTERHDVLGITRQACPLDGVISDQHCYTNNSFNSESAVPIRMSSLLQDEIIVRSASDSDLRGVKPQLVSSPRYTAVDVTSEGDSGIEKSGRYSPSSLDSVHSQSSATNPQVSVRLPLKKHSHIMNGVTIDRDSDRCIVKDGGTKVTMPHPSSAVYERFKTKQSDHLERGRLTQKTRTKLKAGGKAILSSANSVLRPNATIVTTLDDEERSVGSPSEEDMKIHLSPFGEGLASHRTLSTGSLAEVNESPSPSRRRRNKFVTSSPAYRRRVIPHNKQTQGSKEQLVLDIDPRDTKISLEMAEAKSFVNHVSSRKNSGNRNKNSELEMDHQLSRSSDSGYRPSRASRNSVSKERRSRPSVLRKLVYDETDLVETGEKFLSNENPCYIND